MLNILAMPARKFGRVSVKHLPWNSDFQLAGCYHEICRDAQNRARCREHDDGEQIQLRIRPDVLGAHYRGAVDIPSHLEKILYTLSIALDVVCGRQRCRRRAGRRDRREMLSQAEQRLDQVRREVIDISLDRQLR
jgi:hypothetical protein